MTGSGPAYASYARNHIRNSRMSYWAIAVLVGLTVVVEERGVRFGTCRESCARCGADSYLSHLSVFGFDVYSARTIAQAGPLSKFIESYGGGRCHHQWEVTDEHYGSVFRRWAGSYGTPGLLRSKMIGELESLPTLPAVLREKAQNDPTFAARLSQAIRLETPEVDTAFLEDLRKDADAAGTKKGRASEPENGP